MDENSFDWDARDNKDVVIPRVDAIAIYTNSDKDIVIRQRDAIPADISTSPYAQPEDGFVILPRQHLPKVIQRLKELLAED
jgi:hypothetical protein